MSKKKEASKRSAESMLPGLPGGEPYVPTEPVWTAIFRNNRVERTSQGGVRFAGEGGNYLAENNLFVETPTAIHAEDGAYVKARGVIHRPNKNEPA